MELRLRARLCSRRRRDNHRIVLHLLIQPVDTTASFPAPASATPPQEHCGCVASTWPRRPKPVAIAAEETDSTGAASSPCGGDGVGRARSLTDDYLEELKGCADLGFGFSYDEIPELRGTLPALELCYSMTMSQRFLDQPQTPQEQETATATPTSTTTSPPIANWKISSPGDSTEEVKARLK